MTGPDPGRRTTTATHVLLGVLLAGTGLYLVPALALEGRFVPAVFAAAIGLGLVALWFLYRADRRRADRRVTEERRAHERYRALLDHGTEGQVIIGPDGAVRFATANTRFILGIDPDRLRMAGALLDLVQKPYRWHVLRAFAALRRQPGASLALEVAAWHADGSDCYIDLRAANLIELPSIGGIVFSLRDITPRKTFQEGFQHLAYYDAVTGLANRRFFFEQGRRALSLARRRDQAAAVFYLDLDRFQRVNEGLGPEKGEELLGAVAQGLQRAVRDTDVVARLGGDEFAVVLTEVRDVEAARRVARRILGNLPSSVRADTETVTVDASMGIALFPDDGEDLDTLLKAADTAMYRAKTRGEDVQFYRPELGTALGERDRLERELERGLERHELHLHYQPVFHLVTGQMVGAEALSRWRHVGRGLITASEFIGLAERSGLIRSLDRWAIGRAVHQRTSHVDGGWVGWVAVNVSPLTLADPGLTDYVRQVMEAAQLQPGSLVLEMPESAVLGDTEAAADLMWEIKNTGAAIALDDFGAGTSSLAGLKRLPVDILKLDQQFIAGIGDGGGDEHLVEAAIAIAHGIRAKVLAKGVERDEQVDWLRDAGCDFLQGYLMGAPVPAADLGERPSEKGLPR